MQELYVLTGHLSKELAVNMLPAAISGLYKTVFMDNSRTTRLTQYRLASDRLQRIRTFANQRIYCKSQFNYRHKNI